MASNPSLPLACPRCATRYPLDERFCAECGMPLTYAGKVDVEEPASETRARARKINPEYTRGDLRRVATARQQPEAELIQMLLLGLLLGASVLALLIWLVASINN